MMFFLIIIVFLSSRGLRNILTWMRSGKAVKHGQSCCLKTFDILQVRVYEMKMAQWTQERVLACMLREAHLLALPDMLVLTSHPGHGNCS